MAELLDPNAPFIENDRLEIAIEDFAAYAYKRARSMEPDVQLQAIEFQGVRRNGVISVKGDFGSAKATFFSPHKWIRPATIAADQAWTPLATLTIVLGVRGVASQWSWSTDDKHPPPLPLPKCKPSQLWSKVRQLHPTIDNLEKSFGLRVGYDAAGTWNLPHDLTKLADDCK